MFKKNKDKAETQKIENKDKIEKKEKKPLSPGMKKTIAISVAVLAVIIIAFIGILVIQSNMPKTAIEAFLKPAAQESEYISEVLNGEGFSLDVKGDSPQSGDISDITAQYDGRTGDLSAQVMLAGDTEPDSALYIRDNVLVYKASDDNTYYQIDTDAEPDKLPLSINKRIEELWEAYEKQSDKKKLLKPYNKIIKSGVKDMEESSEKQTISLLGKDKKVTAYTYKLQGEAAGELIDELLEQFTEGDKLYDLVNQLYEQYGEEIFDDCDTVEDMIDKVEDIRRQVVQAQGSITWVQYKTGGFFGIGKKVVAESYTISTLGENPCTWQLYIKGYTKSKQADKQIEISYSRGGEVVKYYNFEYTAVKNRGQIDITGQYEDNILADSIKVDITGSSDSKGDVVTTSLDIDVSIPGSLSTYSCSLDSELQENCLSLHLDWIDGQYDIELENSAGSPSFPDVGELNVTEIAYEDLFAPR